MLLGKHTTDNRPYELGLTGPEVQQVHSRVQRWEGAPMIMAQPSKAFSQLEIASYQGLDQPL